jgi:cyanophycinase-like exopeptidase
MPEWKERIIEGHKDKTVITIDEYTGLFWGDDEARVVGLGEVKIFENGEMKSYKDGKTIKSLVLES